MEFDPASFNTMFNGFGQSVDWRRAHDCPCRDATSGGQNPDCQVCYNGKIWEPGVPCTITPSGMKIQREWAQSGKWESGDVAVTLPSDSPAFGMHEFDRVTFCQSSVPFSVKRVNTGAQRAIMQISTIERVFWLNEDLTAIVEGRVPIIKDDGTLFWNTGGPPPGQAYTMSGRKRPEYFCMVPYPQDRALHHGKPMPRKVVLRAFDLFSRAP